MDDAGRVRLGQRRADLDRVERRLVRRERAALLQDRSEVGSGEVLHHHVGSAVVEVPDVVHLGDMLAAKASRRARLAHEALDGLGVVERRREHELDRPQLVQIEVRGRDDDAHTAHAENALDPVFTGEHLSFADGRVRHRRLTARAWPRRRRR
jgi:hypothetical protein